MRERVPRDERNGGGRGGRDGGIGRDGGPGRDGGKGRGAPPKN